MIISGTLLIIGAITAICAAINYPASAPSGEWWPVMLFWCVVIGSCLVVAGLFDMATKDD